MSKPGCYRVWFLTPAGDEGFLAVEAEDAADARAWTVAWLRREHGGGLVTGTRWMREPVLS